VEAIAMLAEDAVAHCPEKFAIGSVAQISRPKIGFVRTSKDIITFSTRWRCQRQQTCDKKQITLGHVVLPVSA